MKSKVYITGTGRAGTTFLMVLCTHLKLDTGFTPKTLQIYKSCNAGMEKRYLDDPYIIKDPNIITEIDKIVTQFKIDRIIIPIRDYEEAAKSRVHHQTASGGLWHATDFETQIQFYYKIMAEYLYVMTKYDIPTTFIDFHQMITSPEYLYKKLYPILGGVGLPEFKRAYDLASLTCKPTQKNNQNKQCPEHTVPPPDQPNPECRE